jgi:hypothetical protein
LSTGFFFLTILRFFFEVSFKLGAVLDEVAGRPKSCGRRAGLELNAINDYEECRKSIAFI